MFATSSLSIEGLEEVDVVTCDEVGLTDQVRGTDGLGSEPQVRDGHGPGLLGVVDEVALRVPVGFGPDDLDGVLVCADGAIAAQPEEDGSNHIVGLGPAALVDVEAGVGDVVDDADGEVILRRVGREFVENRPHHGRGELLRRQAVASADDGLMVSVSWSRNAAEKVRAIGGGVSPDSCPAARG